MIHLLPVTPLPASKNGYSCLILSPLRQQRKGITSDTSEALKQLPKQLQTRKKRIFAAIEGVFKIGTKHKNPLAGTSLKKIHKRRSAADGGNGAVMPVTATATTSTTAMKSNNSSNSNNKNNRSNKIQKKNNNNNKKKEQTTAMK